MYVLSVITAFSAVLVFVAVVVDFILYNKKNTVVKSKRSVVATGSMVGFYIVYCGVLIFRFDRIYYFNLHAMIIGTVMIVTGAIINIAGRIQLKDNWANHIKIYEDHSLVNRGVYKFVRHPLYASIILMLFGGSIAQGNWISIALTAFMFVPMMVYRAKQEETLLRETFAEYDEYAKTTGMFFPKLWR